MVSEATKRITRAMEGNIAAYFHPIDGRLAFLYPNGNINIYDSRTWENIGAKTVRKYGPNGKPLSRKELVGRADMSMSRDGFDRGGRVKGARA